MVMMKVWSEEERKEVSDAYQLEIKEQSRKSTDCEV